MRTAALFCTCDESGWAYCRACECPDDYMEYDDVSHRDSLDDEEDE